MDADAGLGYPVTGYRSSDLAVASRDVARGALVRLMGHASKGHLVAKRELARRAKVGHFPRLAAVPHAAAPPSFVLGSVDALKAQRLQLRKVFGPWGGRN